MNISPQVDRWMKFFEPLDCRGLNETLQGFVDNLEYRSSPRSHKPPLTSQQEESLGHMIEAIEILAERKGCLVSD